MPPMIKSIQYISISIAILYSLNPQSCSAQPDNNNRCDSYARCGPFGICNSRNSPICACVQGFDPVDPQQWTAGNWTSGCSRRVPLAFCPGNGTSNGSRKDGFLDLERMTLSGYSDRWVGPETGCEARCLSNCSCAAYTYDKVGKGCMFWSGALMDIQVIPRGSGSQLHIRVAGFGLGSEKGNKMILIVTVIVGLVIVSVFGFLCWKWVIKRRGQRNASKDEKEVLTDTVALSVQDALSGVNFVEFPLFKMVVLAYATNNFSEDNKLGMGGFGPVYKGELPNGREIAIKRLSKASGQGLQEFMNEVELISKLQHRNLVKILGCCVENNEKILIYEYMPNKSLDVYLFDPSEKILDWRKRLNIIIGICRGLLYLHRDSRLKIIHRDLKPSNILLDNDWNPKISDFGMARIYGTTQDYVSTVRVVGTYGYMAPEYAIEGRFSEKSDVYSFGVLMLEISTGSKNMSFIHGEGFSNLLGHAWKLWNEAKIVKLLDPRISSPSNQADILRCMHIGLLCAQELPKDRPLISSVLSMLTSEIMELPEPKQPAFPVNSSRSNAGTSSSQQSHKSSSSVNNFTVTMVEGR